MKVPKALGTISVNFSPNSNPQPKHVRTFERILKKVY